MYVCLMKSIIKYIVFIFLICVEHVLCYSQHVTATPLKMNMLYYGVKNPLKIVVENYSCSDIIVGCSNGVIIGDDCNYVFESYSDYQREVHIYVGVIKDTTVDWVDTLVFRMMKIPDPYIIFPNWSEIEIMREVGPWSNDVEEYRKKIQEIEIKIRRHFDVGGLIPRLDNFTFDTNFMITEFSVKILRDDDIIFEYLNNSSNRFTRDVLRAILNGLKGDKIILYDFIVRGEDSTIRKLDDTIEYILQ